MDLPGETRNRIYALALPTDGVFELWSDKHIGVLKLPNRGEQWHQYQTVITKQFKLPRVSKQVKTETTRMFYGTNQ